MIPLFLKWLENDKFGLLKKRQSCLFGEEKEGVLPIEDILEVMLQCSSVRTSNYNFYPSSFELYLALKVFLVTEMLVGSFDNPSQVCSTDVSSLSTCTVAVLGKKFVQYVNIFISLSNDSSSRLNNLSFSYTRMWTGRNELSSCYSDKEKRI